MRGSHKGKAFTAKVDARVKELKRTHHTLTLTEAKYLVLDDILNDLPDGAYFAAMAEQGLEADAIINLSESISEKGISI